MVNKQMNNVIEFRSQLMGIAAIGVVCVHSNSIVILPNYLGSLFGYGGIGVYIFVLLSSIGLYNSLKSRGGGYKKAEFYKRRFQRVIVPYLLIAATWYGIKYLLIQQNPTEFFYELSTLSFWINNQGAWYVAMLVPVYLVFPWFYDWVEKTQSSSIRTAKIVITGVSGSVIAFMISIINPQLYSHLSQVFSSIIVYVFGYYCADKVMTDKFNGWLVTVVCLLFYILKTITPLKNLDFISSISWSLLSIPIITVSVWLLSKVNTKPIDDLLGFFGKYSLEMYLWNIFLIQAIKYFGIIEWLKKYGDESGYMAYGIVVVGGVVLSVVYGKLTNLIIIIKKNS